MALNVTVNASPGVIEFDINGAQYGAAYIDANGNLTISTYNSTLYLGAATSSPIALPGYIGGVLQTDNTGNLQVTNQINATSKGWTTARNFNVIGDFMGTVAIDGSQDVSLQVSLPDIINAGGPFNGFSLDSKGRVREVYNFTTINDYGLVDAVSNRFRHSASGDTYYTLPDNQGKYFTSPTQVNGHILVRLPVYFDGAFIAADILVVELNTGNRTKVHVSGLLNQQTNTWTNSTANIVENTLVVNNVLLGADTVSCYIILENAAGGWNGLSVLLTNILVTKTDQSAWTTGYAITVETGDIGLFMSVPPIINAETDSKLLDGNSASFYLDFSNSINRPTSLAGYGIADALSSRQNGQLYGSLTVGTEAGQQVLSIPTGNLTMPSLALIGDPTTGLSFNAIGAGYIGLSSLGVAAFEVVSASQFRFGNSSPASGLIVQTNITAGTLFAGAAITKGGYWLAGTGSQMQTSGYGTKDGAASIVMFDGSASAKFAFMHLSDEPDGSPYLAAPTSLLEIWPPDNTGGQAANNLRITAATLGDGPKIDVTGVDANISLTIASKGTGNIIFNSPLTFNTSVYLPGTTIARFGDYATVSPNTRVSVNPLAVSLTQAGNALNAFPSLHLQSPSTNFVSGAVETGIRTGMQIDWLVSDPDFLGVLNEQRGLWLRHGNYSSSGAGTINRSIGLYIEMPGGGFGVTTTSYGLYQTSVFANTQNYLGSPLSIGASDAVVFAANQYLNVAGDANVQGTVTANKFVLNAGSQATGAHKENAANPLIQVYRNVADFYEAASVVTGTLKITLPFGWSNTTLLFKIMLSFIYGTPSVELTVTGSNVSYGPWNNASATALGPIPGNSVRLAYDGTNCCILIGTLSTQWDWPTVLVKEVVATYDNVDAWDTGWSIAIVNSEQGLSGFVQPVLNQLVPNLGGGSGGGITINDVNNIFNSGTAKLAARVATTANINLASPGAAIDSVTLNAGDRVLVADQGDLTTNGIYVFNGATTPMSRAPDAVTWSQVVGATITSVEGATLGGVTWLSRATESGNIGSTNLPFAQFNGNGNSGGGNANTAITVEGSTTDGETLVTLTTDGNAPSSGNQITLTASGTISCVVQATATGQSAQWSLTYGVTVSGGNAVLTPINVTRNSYTSGAANWNVFLTTNSTTLALLVMGADGTSIAWNASVTVVAG
jgi:hypothetical protein